MVLLIICCHFQLHISLKVAKSMVNVTSQLCGDLQLAVWLSRGDVTHLKLSTCGCLTNLRNKPQQKQHRQLSAPIPAKLLVNVYRYRAVVKSVSCCCVCMVAGFSPIQLYMLFFTENVLGYHIQSLFFNKSSMKHFLCILALQWTITFILWQYQHV